MKPVPQKHWYLVYAKPRQERAARENLARQGYAVYLPLLRIPRRKMGQRVIRVEPMFPRYLFIYLDREQDNWAPIRSTIGVSKLVRFGPEPSPVPDSLIQALREREDVEGVQDLPLHTFEAGQRVRIEEGPFMGYDGIFLAKTSQERVLVLLDIVGKAARARVDLNQLGPVED